VILQQEVSRAEMQKLLETGKTSLLKGFVSARTRRKFSAYLVRGADGKVGFEFEPRAPKAPKPGAAKPVQAEPDIKEEKAAKPAKPATAKAKARKRA
jgi:DNA topoisomerase-3